MGVAATVMAITMTVMLGSSARADDSLLASQSRIARDAAAHGHCDVVGEIAAQVAQTDQNYYTREFLADPTLGYCLGVPGAQPPLRAILDTSLRREPSAAPLEKKPARTPPLDGFRISGELLLGGLSTVIGGLVVEHAVSGGNDNIGEAVVGAVVGGGLGCALGVYAVGSVGDQHGSYGAALGGAGVGALTAFGIAAQLHSDSGAVTAYLVLPALGSTVLFNLTRSYDVHVVAVPTSHGLALAGTF